MHALIVNRGEAKWSPEGHQVHGFSMHAHALEQRLGMTHEMVATETLADVEEAILNRPADVAFVMVAWKEKPEAVVELFQRLSRRHARPRLVFLDYYAPASTPFFGVLPYVDAYLKRQMYREPMNYLRKYEGGNQFTEFMARDLGIDLKGWEFSSEPDPAHLHKLVHGWNLGVTPHYRQLLRLTRSMPLPWDRRPFAVNCRMGVAQGPRALTEWYHLYRDRCANALSDLRREYRCTGAGRVKLRYYFAEMILSRVGVSPFGWGEVCFRDYEVVAAGALLVKPSMSHLKTSPNIYQEGKTYVPCAWDLSDLTDICRHYLAHPEQAKEIVHNAQVALTDYFDNDTFVEDVSRVLATADLYPEGVDARGRSPASHRNVNRVPIMV